MLSQSSLNKMKKSEVVKTCLDLQAQSVNERLDREPEWQYWKEQMAEQRAENKKLASLLKYESETAFVAKGLANRFKEDLDIARSLNERFRDGHEQCEMYKGRCQGLEAENEKLKGRVEIMEKCKKVWYDKCQEDPDDDPDQGWSVKWSICLEGGLNHFMNEAIRYEKSYDELKEENEKITEQIQYIKDHFHIPIKHDQHTEQLGWVPAIVNYSEMVEAENEKLKERLKQNEDERLLEIKDLKGGLKQREDERARMMEERQRMCDRANAAGWDIYDTASEGESDDE